MAVKAKKRLVQEIAGGARERRVGVKTRGNGLADTTPVTD